MLKIDEDKTVDELTDEELADLRERSSSSKRKKTVGLKGMTDEDLADYQARH